jgi:DNA-binding PadR family transcriptional regulator
VRQPLRFSPTAKLVLERFAAAPARWHHGYALMVDLDLPSGTLYPILMRLADAGWLETCWEPAGREGRPPRHLYRLTRGATAEARALVAQWAQRELVHRVSRAAT